MDAHQTLSWHTPGSAPRPVAGEDMVFLASLALISLVCIVHLWRRHAASPLEKLGLTIVALVPVIGPLLYGSVYTRAGPPPQPPVTLPRARALPPRAPRWE